jgi:hypothetical protein
MFIACSRSDVFPIPFFPYDEGIFSDECVEDDFFKFCFSSEKGVVKENFIWHGGFYFLRKPDLFNFSITKDLTSSAIFIASFAYPNEGK